MEFINTDFLIIGDVHGLINKYWKLHQKHKGPSIQVGDFGFKKQHEWHLANMNSDLHKINFGNHDDTGYLHRPYSLGNWSTLPEHPTGWNYDRKRCHEQGQAPSYRRKRLVGRSEAEPLYPAFMSGSNLVDLYRNIKKVAKPEVYHLTDRFSMSTYIHQPIGTYSAGMAKKLSLLLAFMGSAPLIILDEPLITLDAEAVEIVADIYYTGKV